MKGFSRTVNRALRLGLWCGVGLAGAAQAQSGPDLRLSGFGTIGFARTDNARAEFIQAGQPSGGGSHGSFEPDSRLGLQADASFTQSLSGTVQLLSRYDGEGNQRPRVEWAFGKLRLGDGVSMRAGRIGLPLFAVSDFREVGYANTWLRTPTDVYGQVFARSFDGVDLLVDGRLAGMPYSLQALAGRTSGTFDHVGVDLARNIGVNATLEVVDGVTLRLGHVRSRLSVDSDALRQLNAVLAPTPFASVGRQLECRGSKASFSGLGVALDRDAWVGAAEYTWRRTGCVVSDTTGWHLMLGRRFGAWTPYAIVSALRVDDDNVDATIPTGLSPDLDRLAGAVNAATGVHRIGQRSFAIGTRWDAWRNVAIKAQWERIDTRGGHGLFQTDGAGLDRPVQVLSLAVDFVF